MKRKGKFKGRCGMVGFPINFEYDPGRHLARRKLKNTPFPLRDMFVLRAKIQGRIPFNAL